MAKKLPEAPSYSQVVAAKAAYMADRTAANGRAWAIAINKCFKEVGLPTFLPDGVTS